MQGTAIDGSAVDVNLTLPGTGGAVWTTAGFQAIASVTWSGVIDDDVLFTGNIPDQTNQASYVPLSADLQDIGGKIAASYALNPAGDMIGGAGIASKSQSFGGVSQSISTTSSPENAGYSARLKRYDAEIKAAKIRIRKRFHGIGVLMT